MQNFIEQQFKIIEDKSEVIYDELWYVNPEDIKTSLQALKAHMIQEFESRVPREAEILSDKLIEYNKIQVHLDRGFNECRSIMLEEINKLKNE